MDLPTVTEEDLRGFHSKHFPSAPLPAVFFHVDDTSVEAYEEEDDDGLGYYVDGVKRTLTDEQIAIFRHTEIQTIIKELRQARQDKEADGACTPTSEESDHGLKKTMAEFTPYGEGVKRKRLDLSSLVPRKRSNNRLPDPEPGWEDISKMRNWEPEMTWEGGDKSPDHFASDEMDDKMPRRVAREEDDLKVENIELDY
ncbi:uncharacterized protein BDZ99DRAFT_464488 [Mytilinidion resinicola]|uniref:Uncharacterized protein n=1 Tax=Mytilinidion resinicola TaxID=574789 RepID=A0A6A6YJE5_9PEZI|nr:uncharacterized protein BDZ99DRAFT_464488 [Mytilinidion resinicola]KAF2808643.1 hypothetical protein BDZ99DRAFT_464488 [Mytilinidion resinicola]